ncbi:response regulator receiver protein [Flavobacterium rivuli WB 3.3-2 = DSM 21788]|uniref:Response regulator receiver protein n=1 Tax=Flavobacterium rivuli WB 3.3-2 = DSM 21788 TaxID=1121895 RepID=A0A0A2M433_9FLAO|nr:response regulator [Flavobacterium rivuli]KGO86168.1 response regulator receiver protein [Flavobacterium rivuli WB 3.3-2 = DSM 21788]
MILTNLHIVIAEDDPDDGMLVVESFTRNDFYAKVNLVNNGEELVEYLKNNTNNIPDIILTDINMPIMNGIEALIQIKDNSEFNKIPCFVYSTSINPSYEARGRELGVKGFLIKPFSLEEFDDIPNKIISILDNA